MKWLNIKGKYGDMKMVNANLIARIEYPVNLNSLLFVLADGETLEEVYEQEESRQRRYEEIQAFLNEGGGCPCLQNGM